MESQFPISSLLSSCIRGLLRFTRSFDIMLDVIRFRRTEKIVVESRSDSESGEGDRKVERK